MTRRSAFLFRDPHSEAAPQQPAILNGGFSSKPSWEQVESVGQGTVVVGGGAALRRPHLSRMMLPVSPVPHSTTSSEGGSLSHGWVLILATCRYPTAVPAGIAETTSVGACAAAHIVLISLVNFVYALVELQLTAPTMTPTESIPVTAALALTRTECQAERSEVAKCPLPSRTRPRSVDLGRPVLTRGRMRVPDRTIGS
jgi:hypothetical protein